MKKPNRTPDFILRPSHVYWFKEMIACRCDELAEMKFEEGVLYLRRSPEIEPHPITNNWSEMNGIMHNAYKNYLADSVLLDYE